PMTRRFLYNGPWSSLDDISRAIAPAIHNITGGLHVFPIHALHRRAGPGPGDDDFDRQRARRIEISQLEGPMARHPHTGCGRPERQVRSDQGLWKGPGRAADAGISEDP